MMDASVDTYCINEGTEERCGVLVYITFKTLYLSLTGPWNGFCHRMKYKRSHNTLQSSRVTANYVGIAVSERSVCGQSEDLDWPMYGYLYRYLSTRAASVLIHWRDTPRSAWLWMLQCCRLASSDLVCQDTTIVRSQKNGGAMRTWSGQPFRGLRYQGRKKARVLKRGN
ncbi:hypothetical protein L209DRAFT_295068 [Thermothelomyces heterothallicus CBS 203.75]